jgi:hypothetical protein
MPKDSQYICNELKLAVVCCVVKYQSKLIGQPYPIWDWILMPVSYDTLYLTKYGGKVLCVIPTVQEE